MGTMKDRFSRFSVRFLTALLLGLAGLLLHGRLGVLRVAAPMWASPWELSKLVYWPVLAALALSARASGGMKKTLCAAAPYLTLFPPALCGLLWAVSPLHPGAGLYIVLWVALSAVSLALADQGRELRGRGVWPVLAAALGAAYLLFTFLPPGLGPFLDMADAAAMATLPC
jgi:hypothetical protein